jgi:hypothetical protein
VAAEAAGETGGQVERVSRNHLLPNRGACPTCKKELPEISDIDVQLRDKVQLKYPQEVGNLPLALQWQRGAA